MLKLQRLLRRGVSSDRVTEGGQLGREVGVHYAQVVHAGQRVLGVFFLGQPRPHRRFAIVQLVLRQRVHERLLETFVDREHADELVEQLLLMLAPRGIHLSEQHLDLLMLGEQAVDKILCGGGHLAPIGGGCDQDILIGTH